MKDKTNVIWQLGELRTNRSISNVTALKKKKITPENTAYSIWGGASFNLWATTSDSQSEKTVNSLRPGLNSEKVKETERPEESFQ